MQGESHQIGLTSIPSSTSSDSQKASRKTRRILFVRSLPTLKRTEMAEIVGEMIGGAVVADLVAAAEGATVDGDVTMTAGTVKRVIHVARPAMIDHREQGHGEMISDAVNMEMNVHVEPGTNVDLTAVELQRKIAHGVTVNVVAMIVMTAIGGMIAELKPRNGRRRCVRR